MEVRPFQGWVEDFCVPRASLRTATLSPRLFAFLPFGNGAATTLCPKPNLWDMLSLASGTTVSFWTGAIFTLGGVARGIAARTKMRLSQSQSLGACDF